MMLQQTQVERVIPFYKKFVRAYPTARTLAKAPLGDVLKMWQGLGYNRRAKALHEAVKAATLSRSNLDMSFPKTLEELEKLPGVGPYTAGAIMAFAHNADVVLIETNIRTAIIHHFFSGGNIRHRMSDITQKRNSTIYGTVSDAEIAEVLQKVLPQGQARAWYSALMDYGTHLKRSGVKTNAKVKGYTKQSKFAGSNREIRGAVLRALSRKPSTKALLEKLFNIERKKEVGTQIEKLLKEGMISKTGSLYSLPK